MEQFARRALVGSAVFLGLAVLLLVLYSLRVVLVVVFLALVLAAAIRPAALRLQADLGIGFTVAVILVYVTVLLVGVVVVLLMTPILIAEFLAFVETYLVRVQELIDAVGRLTAGFDELPDVATQLRALTEVGLSAVRTLVTLPLSLISLAAWGVSILVLAFYWLLERDFLLWRMGRLSPPAYRERVYQVWVAVERKLGLYVLGQMISSATIGVLTLVGLLVLGVRFALVLALLAAITEVIPIIGPFIAGIPAVIIASFQDPLLGLTVVALYVVIQQAEANLVYPQVQAVISRIPAFWLLLALLVGAELMGVLGALVAVPVAATISAFLEELIPGAPSAEAAPREKHEEQKAA